MRQLVLACTAWLVLVCVGWAADASDNSRTPAEVFAGMEKSFQKEKAKGLHAKYLFHLANPQGGDWWIKIDDGKCAMGKGKIEKPDCTFNCTGDDWVALGNGTMGGMRAFLTGRLKFEGNQGLARKLDELFP